MNICLNALESMDQGGQLSIRTYRRELSAPWASLDGEIPVGVYAVLEVKDSGEGIPKEMLEHIFEPFFTRKKLGHSGTGLGLSVVYGVTHDLGGKIHVETEAGEGSIFTLYFPATSKELKKVDENELPEGRNERILVVDDVEAQRRLATRLLDQVGYRVAQAESGQAALDYIQREHVDVVLLDMIMDTGWDGPETYRQLKQVRPNIRCIICSGYSDRESIDELNVLGLNDHIMKPYSIADLAQLIREVLDRPEQAAQGKNVS